MRPGSCRRRPWRPGTVRAWPRRHEQVNHVSQPVRTRRARKRSDGRGGPADRGHPRSGLDLLTIQVVYVKSLLDAGERVVLVDLRPTDEYQKGHLPGARSFPLKELQERYQEIPTRGLWSSTVRAPAKTSRPRISPPKPFREFRRLALLSHCVFSSAPTCVVRCDATPSSRNRPSCCGLRIQPMALLLTRQPTGQRGRGNRCRSRELGTLATGVRPVVKVLLSPRPFLTLCRGLATLRVLSQDSRRDLSQPTATGTTPTCFRAPTCAPARAAPRQPDVARTRIRQ
jgi:Rhodanese-like domain